MLLFAWRRAIVTAGEAQELRGRRSDCDLRPARRSKASAWRSDGGIQTSTSSQICLCRSGYCHRPQVLKAPGCFRCLQRCVAGRGNLTPPVASLDLPSFYRRRTSDQNGKTERTKYMHACNSDNENIGKWMKMLFLNHFTSRVYSTCFMLHFRSSTSSSAQGWSTLEASGAKRFGESANHQQQQQQQQQQKIVNPGKKRELLQLIFLDWSTFCPGFQSPFVGTKAALPKPPFVGTVSGRDKRKIVYMWKNQEV